MATRAIGLQAGKRNKRFFERFYDFVNWMETNDYVYPRCRGATERETRLGNWISKVRAARRGKGDYVLTPRRIMFLNAVNFAWEGDKSNQHIGPLRAPFPVDWKRRNNIEEEEEDED